MKLSSRPVRTPSSLSDSLHRQLNLYAVAASAAGVGMLAQSAEAVIVYTPAHTTINRGFPGILHLDLNHDGNSDFRFENWWNSDSDGTVGFLSVLPSAANGIRGYSTGNNFVFFASALRVGQKIGPKQQFVSPRQNDWMWLASDSFGQWDDVNNRYLGLRIVIKGKTHYGWARLNVHSSPENYKRIIRLLLC